MNSHQLLFDQTRETSDVMLDKSRYIRTDFLMRKKNYGFTPNLDFNPLPTRFNLASFRLQAEYAAHRGRREQVEGLIDSRTLKERYALVARTEIQQTQEL